MKEKGNQRGAQGLEAWGNARFPGENRLCRFVKPIERCSQRASLKMRASGTDAGCGRCSAFGDDGIETVGIIKVFQVFAVNAFGLAVVTGRIGAECPAWMQ